VEEEKKAYRLWVGTSEGKRPLGNPIRRWVDNIKTLLGETERGGMDWIGLVQDRDNERVLVKAIMNHRVPLTAGSSRVATQLLGAREGKV
jgi:hypothetical protein